MDRSLTISLLVAVIIFNHEIYGQVIDEFFRERYIASESLRGPLPWLLGGNASLPEHVRLDPADNITDRCKSVMEHIAIEGGNFTYCMLGNARPFSVCENCVTFYTRFHQLITDLSKDDSCSVRLLMSDKMQIIASVSTTFDLIWTNANCDNCFSDVHENATTGVVVANPSPDFVWFKTLQENVTRCFNDSTDWDWSDNVPNNTERVCSTCKNFYRAMNKFYSDLVDNSSRQVCMDITDMMNKTRLRWSIEYGCNQGRPEGIVVYFITAILATSVVALYTLSAVCFRVRKLDVYRTTRMSRRSGRYGSMTSSGPQSLTASLQSRHHNMVIVNSDEGADANRYFAGNRETEVEATTNRPSVLG